jgi:uncharacterized membrane protein
LEDFASAAFGEESHNDDGIMTTPIFLIMVIMMLMVMLVMMILFLTLIVIGQDRSDV